MKKQFGFIAIALTVLLSACSSGNDNPEQNANKDSAAVIQREDFKKAEVLDQIKIKAKPEETYSLYLPSSYDASKKYPVIIAFDPHADGKLPLSLYKQLAEQYGYILIGSNVSKNGMPWDATKYVVNNLYTDVLQRFSVDSQRVYLMGFSGGARVANGATIIHGGIAGVICCGAAYPAINAENPRNNYVYLGIVGLNDFNYTEMRKYDLVDLAGHNLKHALVTFDGKHEWPPLDVMNEGFLYFEYQNMRKDLSKKNDALVNKFYQSKVKELDSLMNGKYNYEAYQLSRRTINFYDALIDLKPFYNAYNILKTDKIVDKALQDQEQEMQEEDRQKQQYNQSFQSKDISWWQKETRSLQQKASTKNAAERQRANRMLSYLSLVAYMQASGALAQNNIPAAEYFDKIYMTVDPTNNEAYYLNAVINAKLNKANEAIASLSKAVEYGFNDKARVEIENAFTSLSSNNSFVELVNKMK